MDEFTDIRDSRSSLLLSLSEYGFGICPFLTVSPDETAEDLAVKINIDMGDNHVALGNQNTASGVQFQSLDKCQVVEARPGRAFRRKQSHEHQGAFRGNAGPAYPARRLKELSGFVPP